MTGGRAPLKRRPRSASRITHRSPKCYPGPRCPNSWSEYQNYAARTSPGTQADYQRRYRRDRSKWINDDATGACRATPRVCANFRRRESTGERARKRTPKKRISTMNAEDDSGSESDLPLTRLRPRVRRRHVLRSRFHRTPVMFPYHGTTFLSNPFPMACAGAPAPDQGEIARLKSEIESLRQQVKSGSERDTERDTECNQELMKANAQIQQLRTQLANKPVANAAVELDLTSKLAALKKQLAAEQARRQSLEGTVASLTAKLTKCGKGESACHSIVEDTLKAIRGSEANMNPNMTNIHKRFQHLEILET